MSLNLLPAIRALRASLPSSVRREVGWNPVAIFNYMWDNWDAPLATRFLGNVVYNQVEDAIVGRAHRWVRKTAQPHRNPFDGSTRIFTESFRGGLARESAYQLGVNP